MELFNYQFNIFCYVGKIARFIDMDVLRTDIFVSHSAKQECE